MSVTRLERSFDKVPVSILNGGNVSGGIKVAGKAIAAIVTPAAWTAGVLAFEASLDDGSTWIPVFDDAAAEVAIASATIVTNRILVDNGILNKLRGLTHVRLASGPAGARVAQGAQRDFIVLVKSI